MKPRVHCVFSVLFCMGSGGMLHQKILKIRRSEMLFTAISVIYLLRCLVDKFTFHIHMPPISRKAFIFLDSFSDFS